MKDAKMCMMICGAADCLVNEDLVRAVEDSREQMVHHFVIFLHFPQISRSLLHKIVSDKLRFRKLCSRWVPKLLTDEHKMKQATWHA
jgi:hypothetical protein